MFCFEFLLTLRSSQQSLPLGAFVAISLVARLENEISAAQLTAFCFAAANLRIKIEVYWQHTPQKIVTVDPTAGDGLHTTMLIAIVKQQAIAVSVIAAAF